MNQTLSETLKILTGGKPVSYYLAGTAFSLVAILLSIYHHSKKRDPFAPLTPLNFNLWFMLWDNAKRAIVTLLMMFIIFRLFDCSNVGVMIGVGFFLALGLDKAIQWLMEFTNVANLLKTDRTKFPGKAVMPPPADEKKQDEGDKQ